MMRNKKDANQSFNQQQTIVGLMYSACVVLLLYAINSMHRSTTVSVLHAMIIPR